MDDTLVCPICLNSLRNTKSYNKYLHPIGKKADYMERVCTGYNHVLIMWTDQNTKKVDFIKMALEPIYSKVISVDFFNKKTTLELKSREVRLMQNTNIIEIPKVLELDFPDLSGLQEKMMMYSLFT